MFLHCLRHKQSTLHAIVDEQPIVLLGHPLSDLENIQLELIEKIHHVPVSHQTSTVLEEALFSHPLIREELAEIVSPAIREQCHYHLVLVEVSRHLECGMYSCPT